MTLRRLLALGVAGMLVAQGALAGDCALKRLATVDLELDEGGRLLIPVTLQESDVLMGLDLGDWKSHFTQDAAEQLKLSVTDSPWAWYVINGKQRAVRVAAFGQLAIGPARFGKGAFDIYVPTSSTNSPSRAAGNLGMDVLGSVDFELDMAHMKMSLYLHNHCRDSVVYWTRNYSAARMYRSENGSVMLPMELEGKRIEASFSKFADTTLRTDLTRMLFGFDEKSPGNEVAVGDSGKESAHFRAMRLTAQGLNATNVDIRLLPPFGVCKPRRGDANSAAGYTQCIGAYPLMIGTRLLSKLHLYFATDDNVLYYSIADAS
jgi:hypothetical protein